MKLFLLFICFFVVFNDGTILDFNDKTGKHFKLLGTGCLDKNDKKPIFCDITNGNTLNLAQCQNVCLESPRCLSIEYKERWGCRLFFGVLEHVWRLEFEDLGTCTHPEHKKTVIPTEVSKAFVNTCDVNGEPCCYKHIQQEFPENIGEFFLLGLDACGRGKSRYLDSSNMDGISTAHQCAKIATKKGSPSFSWAEGGGVGRCRVHSQHPYDLYSEWRWDWVCYTTNSCNEKAVNKCTEHRKLPCSPGPSKECGDCLPGYKPVHYVKKFAKCIDVCNTKAKLRCTTYNRHPCESLSETCGDCRKGFKPVEGKDKCVDLCDQPAMNICSQEFREPCVNGSPKCGACVDGFVDNKYGTCVNVCDENAIQFCADIFRESCKSGLANCGNCIKGYMLNKRSGSCVQIGSVAPLCDRGYKNVQGKCVGLCDNTAKARCHRLRRKNCEITSTDCGHCKSGWKEVQGVSECIDVCDIKAKQHCIDRHRNPCKRGTERCGLCLEGWVHDPETKTCLDVCSPNRRTRCHEYNREHCLPYDKECGGCLEGFKEVEMKDDKEKCIDTCDQDAKKYCHQTFQLACKSGSTKCGMCKHGYYRHNGDCRKRINDRKYWAFNDCTNEGKFYDVGKFLAVRCCSKTTNDVDTPPAGKFEFGSVTCHKKNYYEASEWCETQNRSLCTREQLESSTSCTRFRLMGCSFDTSPTWTSLHDWGCPAVGGYSRHSLKERDAIPTIEACFDFCETVNHEGQECQAVDYNHETKVCRALKHTYEIAHDPTLEDSVVANRHGHCPATLGRKVSDHEVGAHPHSNWGCLVLGQSYGERIGHTIAKKIDDCFDFCEDFTDCLAVSYDIRTKECHALQIDYKVNYEKSEKMILANRWNGCADQKPVTYGDIVKNLNIEETDFFVNERTAPNDLPNLMPITVGAGQLLAPHNFFESRSFQFALTSMGCFIALYSGYLYGKKKPSENIYMQI